MFIFRRNRCMVKGAKYKGKRSTLLMKCQAPPVFSGYIGKLAEAFFNDEAFDRSCWLGYEVDAKCFSKKLTNDELIQFYSNDNCFTQKLQNELGKPMCNVMRLVITRFLGKDHIHLK